MKISSQSMPFSIKTRFSSIDKFHLVTVLIILIFIPWQYLHSAEIEKKSSFKDGLYLQSDSKNYTAHIDLRTQFRYTNIDYDNTFSNPNRDNDELKLNRARFKIGGIFGAEWLKYYSEYNFVNSVLIDLWIQPKVNESLMFRIGQYKVPYNRERFESSGKQQFAERSIVNPPFTLDRQIGITVEGRLFKEQIMDSNYYVGVFFGNGRSGSRDSHNTPMVFGRWQWNIFQQVLPFTRSDITRHNTPAASLSVAAATNRSAFTKFSTAGGGSLPGFKPGQSDQYDVDQAMAEFAFMYQGFSIQSEYHWKKIDDRLNQRRSSLDGFYFDMGYFFSELIEWVPEPLELIARYATVDPDSIMEELQSKEIAFGGNWFFYGHRNKLTLDVTRRTNTVDEPDNQYWGMRFQWDVSF